LLSNELFLSGYTKIHVGWGYAPDPTEGAYIAPRPPSWLRDRKGMEGREGRTRGRGRGEERGKGVVGGIAPWLLGG